jgi:glycerol uptake facilitator-like aquaporin
MKAISMSPRPGQRAASGSVALAVAVVISGPVSGAGVNPARALGPMILAGQFSDWWAYLTAAPSGGSAWPSRWTPGRTTACGEA